jgi:nucleoid DNA-binding protein
MIYSWINYRYLPNMQALITSYLIQKKECNLPLLGHFRIKTKPADFEKANKQIFPPTDEILYSEFAASLSGDLIIYISDLQNITGSEAEEKINNWCKYAREKLDLGEKIIFSSIGSLQKDAAGNIFFQRKTEFSFYDPVSTEAACESMEHSVLTGDKEITSGAMKEILRKNISQKNPWWKICAIVLLAISLLALGFYFYVYGFSETGIGNRASFGTPDPPVLHYAP